MIGSANAKFSLKWRPYCITRCKRSEEKAEASSVLAHSESISQGVGKALHVGLQRFLRVTSQSLSKHSCSSGGSARKPPTFVFRSSPPTAKIQSTLVNTQVERTCLELVNLSSAVHPQSKKGVVSYSGTITGPEISGPGIDLVDLCAFNDSDLEASSFMDQKLTFDEEKGRYLR